MGAWGTGTFDNDEAMDWAFELEESKDFSIVESTLKIITSAEPGAIDTYDASVGLAAGEVVAALLGFETDDLPEEVKDWLDGKPEPPANLVALAQRAVEAVKKHSALRAYWEEAGSLDEWTEAVEDLESRLT
jgi:hypothetical protein